MPKCALCQKRKPRRHCPAVDGAICTQCCGSSREVTLACPLDCIYLREARVHERLVDVDPRTFPNQDIQITESFLVQREGLLLACAGAIADAAFGANNAYDSDVREALEALIRTYRTQASGLYYEAVPDNKVAASVFVRARKLIEAIRVLVSQTTSQAYIRDSEVLGVLVFLQRMALDNDNRRAKSRRFMDMLRVNLPVDEPADIATNLIV